MVSVRDAVEPLNRALGNSTTIFLQGSFVGLPLINQALAAENPIVPGESFFVTVRTLIKVIESISKDAVLKAVKAAAEASAPHPSHPPPPVENPPAAPITPPVISVVAVGDGSFKVSGRLFAAETVISIRVVDKRDPLLPNRFFEVSSSPTGTFDDFPTGKICQVNGGEIVFSAQDGRIDPRTHIAVTSNFFTTTCTF